MCMCASQPKIAAVTLYEPASSCNSMFAMCVALVASYTKSYVSSPTGAKCKTRMTCHTCETHSGPAGSGPDTTWLVKTPGLDVRILPVPVTAQCFKEWLPICSRTAVQTFRSPYRCHCIPLHRADMSECPAARRTAALA